MALWCPRARATSRRLPLQRPRGGAGLVHQPWPHHHADRAQCRGGSVAGGHRLRRQADHRRRGSRHEERRRQPRRPRVGGSRDGAGRGPSRNPAGHRRRTLAAPRLARQSRQRDDPREGAHPRPVSLRGLRALRPHDPGSPGSIEPPAELGDAHFRAGAGRHLADQLRRATAGLLRLGGSDLGAGRATGVFGGNALFGRGLPTVPLAHARNAPADVPGNGAGARRLRQGGSALSARDRAFCSVIAKSSMRCSARIAASRCAAVAGASSSECCPPPHSTAPTPGSPWPPSPAHHAGTDDHVRPCLQARARRADLGAGSHRRDVRGQLVPVESVFVLGRARRFGNGLALGRPAPRRRHPFRKRRLHLSRLGPSGTIRRVALDSTR